MVVDVLGGLAASGGGFVAQVFGGGGGGLEESGREEVPGLPACAPPVR